MVSIYLAQALKNRHIEVRESDARYRDFVYIDDINHFHKLIITEERALNKIFNLATPEESIG